MHINLIQYFNYYYSLVMMPTLSWSLRIT